MRSLISATLITLSLAAPALAEPNQTYELPAGSTLERLQLAQTSPTSAPGKAPDLKDPWVAAGLTLAGPLLVCGLTYGSDSTAESGKLYSVAPPIMGAGPLSLAAGYLYTGALARGAGVVLSGYAAEAAGALIAAPTIALTSGKEGEGAGFAYLSGLFIGPLVALGGFTLWAAFDAYQEAVRHNERALKAIEEPATP